MDGIRPDSATARILADALGSAHFTLIDVGCSGGLDPGWVVFGNRLRAYGFDPSVHEIERLARAETRPQVRYVNTFVTLPEGHPHKGAGGDEWVTNPWRRVSAYQTQQLQQLRAAAATQPPTALETAPAPARGSSPPPETPTPASSRSEPEVMEEAPPPEPASPDEDLLKRNLWHKARLADGSVNLPEFLDAVGVDELDFVKIDVDGADFEVLQSLDALLGPRQVLGVSIEVGYSGVGEAHENSFHNVDRFMRGHGFDLFDLTVRRYALAALPFPFLYPYPIAAQTTRGRPLIGDALYLRDLGHGDHRGPDAWPDDKLIKLTALYCLFGLPDHAMELLTLAGDRLAGRIDVALVAESLAAEIQDIDPELHKGFARFASAAEYLAGYEADHPYFYGAEARLHDQQLAVIAERDAALAALAAEQAAHQQALAAAMQADAFVRAQVAETVAAFTRTISWRVTAPLRAVRRLVGRALRRRRRASGARDRGL